MGTLAKITKSQENRVFPHLPGLCNVFFLQHFVLRSYFTVLRKNTESLSLENNVQDIIRKPKLTYLASNFLFYYICLAYVSNKFNFCTRASEIRTARTST